MKNAIKILFLSLLFGLFGNTGFAQTGEIIGIVYDENGMPFPFTPHVKVSSGGTQIRVIMPDEDGKFVVKPLEPGLYTVQISHQGYKTAVTSVSVSSGKPLFLNVNLKTSATLMGEVDILPPVESMVNETMSTGKKIDMLDFKNIASSRGDVVNIVSQLTPGVMPTPDGKDLYIRGSRRGTTGYIIDGVRVTGSLDVPALSVQGVTVYTGGVPAMYGDVTGGLVVISTKTYFSGMGEKMRMTEQVKKSKENEKSSGDIIVDPE